ncbi:hypothetical protein, partial [Thermogladius sp.]|uniref:hypothetical protein n=1 Tax=Thermogladius sp. TaxID=2023064 RepID=UPI003D12F565
MPAAGPPSPARGSPRPGDYTEGGKGVDDLYKLGRAVYEQSVESLLIGGLPILAEILKKTGVFIVPDCESPAPAWTDGKAIFLTPRVADFKGTELYVLSHVLLHIVFDHVGMTKELKRMFSDLDPQTVSMVSN